MGLKCLAPYLSIHPFFKRERERKCEYEKNECFISVYVSWPLTMVFPKFKNKLSHLFYNILNISSFSLLSNALFKIKAFKWSFSEVGVNFNKQDSNFSSIQSS